MNRPNNPSSQIVALAKAQASIADSMIECLSAAGVLTKAQSSGMRKLIARRLREIKDQDADLQLIWQMAEFLEAEPGAGKPAS